MVFVFGKRPVSIDLANADLPELSCKDLKIIDQALAPASIP
jgi:hypothetical protein